MSSEGDQGVRPVRNWPGTPQFRARSCPFRGRPAICPAHFGQEQIAKTPEDFPIKDTVSDSPSPYTRLTVLGAGSWGTALACVAARAGCEVRLWARSPERAADINATGRNEAYLPGIDLPPGITATAELAEALDAAEAVLLVTPSSTLRSMCQAIAPHIPEGIPLALACKGVEKRTGYLLSEVVSEELPGHPVGAVSGPTFARETALDYPTAATVAFPFRYADRLEPRNSPAARMALSLSGGAFRPYVSDDLVGVEVGGAIKNVIAIACGMMSGAGFAENTRAALITRGTDEMKLLAQALGGRRETVTGLAGAGDLTLTCSSTTSRNMSLGTQLGQGIPRPSCFEGRSVVVEGEVNAVSVTDLAARIGVDMPICETVNAILHKGADLRDAFNALWARPLEAEPFMLDFSLEHPSDAMPIQFKAD
ncbi:NAD(P)-dependent glycerol-3-phosphate dehydrogenase [Pseudooceanicola sp. CBS1P-1]|uniref:Glycerol-3-phosphate dehydrogenase [NAD(P)+] n=1 Tax=Pseudooceanicola albus TaxID=2692189 RepID=A0A6L7GA51_9RHOB|nr:MULTISPECIES: NAD(P)H-dependent glycerol-3-phosphate dehydrogenase [Pseudooceanicola]MBT9386539.1 NAD(P)-dependent glycerol-3-phosphate dehydrogenase [Pseudooceanicola endophyticus]MXN20572.1 NAD(P)H-dependent glycerol-3-phosphate dehydrogenase [Pseudooceanicola albus]